MSTPIIEARALHTYYGASHVLHGIDLALHPGESIGLMGRNGMGKTTLLRSLLGLTPAREGELRVAGRVATAMRPDRIARAGIAYVPEGRRIFPTLSVRENLLLPARTGAWNFSRVIELFPRLAHRLDHGGAQLSGGEQQMLAIGRALMTNPAAILMDEATEGLAPLMAREIWSIVARVRANGIATIIVDRNLAAMAAATDRVMILVKGRVAFTGAAMELQREPELQHRYLGL